MKDCMVWFVCLIVGDCEWIEEIFVLMYVVILGKLLFVDGMIYEGFWFVVEW